MIRALKEDDALVLEARFDTDYPTRLIVRGEARRQEITVQFDEAAHHSPEDAEPSDRRSNRAPTRDICLSAETAREVAQCILVMADLVKAPGR